jgi:hypothetical protein
MRIGRVTGCALALTGVVGAAGCGGGDDRVNRLRPPASINVTAAIVDGRIHVSPRRFGAGPIRLIVSNQTPSAQAVTILTARDDAPGTTQATPPIRPAGTATIELDTRQGLYALRAADRSIRPVAVSVGAPRASAQDQLLQP